MLLSSLAGFSSLLTDTCSRIGIWFKFLLPLKFPWSAHVANDLIVPDRRRCKVLFTHKLLLKFKYLDFKLSELGRQWNSLRTTPADPDHAYKLLMCPDSDIKALSFNNRTFLSHTYLENLKFPNVSAFKESWGQRTFSHKHGKKNTYHESGCVLSQR